MKAKKTMSDGLLNIGAVLILLSFHDSEAWAEAVNYAEYFSTEFLKGLQNMLEQSNILPQQEKKDLMEDFLKIVESLLNESYSDVCELLKVIDTCGEENESLKHGLKSVVGELLAVLLITRFFSGGKIEDSDEKKDGKITVATLNLWNADCGWPPQKSIPNEDWWPNMVWGDEWKDEPAGNDLRWYNFFAILTRADNPPYKYK